MSHKKVSIILNRNKAEKRRKQLEIQKEASNIMIEIEKLNLGSQSDMHKFRKALLRELTKLRLQE